MQGAAEAEGGRRIGGVAYEENRGDYGFAVGACRSLASTLGMWALGVRSRRVAALCHSAAIAAAAGERQRIVRDLHDGLAQDLAFIAAHGDRLAVELGREHPLAVAARRALAVSRGAIAELSAPQAPTAGEALREIGDELGLRFEMRVEVQAEPVVVTPSEREDIVRIAREAIVNAARHGLAQNVVVSLALEGNTRVLTVRDDGIGIGQTAATDGGGFGFLSMHERATALGGRLTARAAASGGTELEVVVP
jgi:signal transduction histidine kinase